MTTWTDTAQQRLDRYFEEIRETLQTSGADPDEVCDDLRRHIDEEIIARKLEVVNEHDVRQILARIGAPGSLEPSDTSPSTNGIPQSTSNSATSKPAKKLRHWLVLIFSIILPFLTLGIEMTTHMCAGVFFDPIPSIWFVLMVGAAPTINLLAWLAVHKGTTSYGRALGIGTSFAMGIAAFYTLLYLPVLPFALIGVLYLGWGLLPMAPLFALIGAIVLHRRLRRVSVPPGQVGGLLPGLGLAALALGLTVLPVTATRYLARQATSDENSTAQQTRAVKWLRFLGHENTLLGDCYGTTSWMRQSPLDLRLFGKPLNTARAREVYFRVTGYPFNTLPPPQLNFSRGGWNMLDDLTWDREQGGERVGSRVKGLSLVSSRLDGLVESNAAIGYLEWTMEFRNESRDQREARAQIALPPGGVVSRLTLWVAGEEREAAFAGRAKVRKAYEQVAIRQRRDPVLVTSCGPDRVLMQCFPVPPEGGTMKIRIGITAPLAMESLENGFLQWPHFLERNFSLPEEFNHSLWVESRARLTSGISQLTTESTPAGKNALRGSLPNRMLEDPKSALRFARSSAIGQVWTPISTNRSSAFISQSMATRRATVPSRIVMVIDGSRSMKQHLPAFIEATKGLPEGAEVSVLFAAEKVVELFDKPQKSSSEFRDELSARLRRLKPAGGRDNVPALLQALDLASTTNSGVVLWVHGAQPVMLSPADELAQRFMWRRERTRLYDFQTTTGPNRVAEKLDGIRAVRMVPRRDTVVADLQRVFDQWSGKIHTVDIIRQRIEPDATAEKERGAEISKHLARLWADEEVERLLSRRVREAAVKLAAEYQLVTSVSGAVVLETQEQFARAGLEPVQSDSVPSVPEPAVLWWLAAGLAGVMAVWRRRKCKA